jgi:TPR repeat protein
MSMRSFAFAALLAAFPMSALASDAAADIDLQQAATLHRSGDASTAMAIWKRWAEKGNVDAAYNLAVIHQYGNGVPYNAAEAVRWYRRAAEGGDKVSQVQLGLMYQNGEGVPADQATAHEWFTKARRDHVHHHQTAQFRQWQQQARALIAERDRREAYVASRRDGDRILAELKRRAGMGDEPGQPVLAALGSGNR